MRIIWREVYRIAIKYYMSTIEKSQITLYDVIYWELSRLHNSAYLRKYVCVFIIICYFYDLSKCKLCFNSHFSIWLFSWSLEIQKALIQNFLNWPSSLPPKCVLLRVFKSSTISIFTFLSFTINFFLINLF